MPAWSPGELQRHQALSKSDLPKREREARSVCPVTWSPDGSCAAGGWKTQHAACLCCGYSLLRRDVSLEATVRGEQNTCSCFSLAKCENTNLWRSLD